MSKTIICYNNYNLLYEFGVNLGIAFQLQDDLLDVYGETKVFGKKIGGDIIAGKKTFLFITAHKTANKKTLKDLNNWIKKKDEAINDKIKAITKIYNNLNIYNITTEKINQYYSFAAEALKKIDIKETRKVEIFKFAERIKKRTN